MKSFFIKTFSHNGQYDIILKKFNKQSFLVDNLYMAQKTGKNKKSKKNLKEKKDFKIKKSTLYTIIGVVAGIAIIVSTVCIVRTIKKRIED